MKPEKRDYKVWQVDNPEYDQYFGEENFNQDILRQIGFAMNIGHKLKHKGIWTKKNQNSYKLK